MVCLDMVHQCGFSIQGTRAGLVWWSARLATTVATWFSGKIHERRIRANAKESIKKYS